MDEWLYSLPGERAISTQNRYGHGGEEKNPITAPEGNRTPVFQPAAQSLYLLSYPGSYIENAL